ncbi:aminotransferase class I/II-fold pyridoxal phosphate-dependent enzyme [Anaerospora sp.]|uniref:aminotransferase class I/II-fold pyridoxal phosphate-dependent enzyme n=1 Tax=Anaerospora sp. TaxID=1960278 RepID=UPI0028988AEB|nr:aminotransferase class I/II-fold pyridoxal phosphate-dependent enzyme [Anaerospora sp.]
MSHFKKLSVEELQQQQAILAGQYEKFQAQKLKLDMSRGKPCSEQLDLSNDLFNCLSQTDYKTANGTDCRNYGGLDGIAEAKELFASFLEAKPQEIIIGGSSSLTMMHDLLCRAMLHGLPESEAPWSKLPTVKFLCPSPGYDRHFAVTEHLGMELITINYLDDGPDMDQVEKLVAADPAIKGIWCVPKYSNPTGLTYSDKVVQRLAAMPTAAADFRIIWDNAYVVHHLTDTPDQLLDIRKACEAAGHADRVFVFASTSKLNFPSAGIAMVASSDRNINWLKKHINIQTIGPDKINQLRHVRFLKDQTGIEEHMRKHAAIIKPKFDLVRSMLETALGSLGIASWSNPQGGYFISLDTLPGCAQKIVEKAAAAGVLLTPAGATFPYGKDPEDKNIRLSPTFPPLSELKQAMELLVLCVQLVSVEQELASRA